MGQISQNNPNVDAYLKQGCGRCKLFATPECKVNTWRKELVTLRNIVLGHPLIEDYKWKMPCYTANDRNILMICAFRDYCALAFFNGAFLNDPKGLLVAPGENSQSVRQLRFTNRTEIEKFTPLISNFIKEAIKLETSGRELKTEAKAIPLPQELKQIFQEIPSFKKAFEKLTPSRQRGYLLFFTAAKQSATRVTRIEKYKSHILAGKGMHDK